MMLNTRIETLRKKGAMFGLSHARDYEMFIKGYCIANIIYNGHYIDQSVKTIDVLISMLQGKMLSFDSWGYALISQCRSYGESLLLFYHYWDDALQQNGNNDLLSDYMAQIRHEIAGAVSYEDFINIVIKSPESIGLIDARDFDMMFTGYVHYNLSGEFIAPSIECDHISDVTFFSIWHSSFKEFLLEYIHLRVETLGIYSLSSYCYLLASTSSLKYLGEILADFSICKKNKVK